MAMVDDPSPEASFTSANIESEENEEPLPSSTLHNIKHKTTSAQSQCGTTLHSKRNSNYAFEFSEMIYNTVVQKRQEVLDTSHKRQANTAI
jgi:hypothetical protein